MAIKIENITIADDGVINKTDVETTYFTYIKGDIIGDVNQTVSTVTIHVPGMIPQVITVNHANGKGTFSYSIKQSDLIAAANATQSGEGRGTVKIIASDSTIVAVDITTQDYIVDTVAPDDNTTTITIDPVTADNIINLVESQSTETKITGKVTGDFVVGDNVNVVVNGVNYKTTVFSSGKYSVNVKTSDLVADTNVSATITAHDVAGNSGNISAVQNYTTNFEQPSVDIALTDAVLSKGESTLVTFTFTEKVNGFDASDITSPSGTITNLQTTDGGKTWTATFTANSNTESSQNIISVAKDSYRNADGNPGKAGQSANYIVDTIAPKAGKLDAPDNTSDKTPTITGSGAEANATVSVTIRDAGGAVIETLTETVDASGNYRVTPTVALEVGNYYATATVSDAVGNTSSVADLGSVIEQGFHHKVWTVASGWNEGTGPVDYAGMKTGAGDDWLQVGNGGKNCWTYASQGNLWNKDPCAGWAVVSTGAGDDRLDLGVGGGWGSMFSYTKVDMGVGDDTYNVKGNIHGNARVLMGEGNDKLNVGIDIDDRAKVYMGAGNDTVHVKEDVENHAFVNLGQGSNTLIVERHVEDSAKIVGAGSDSDSNNVTIKGDLKNCAQLILDGGNDIIDIKGGINNSAKVETGAGNDSLYIAKSFGYGAGSASVDMGSGDDTVTYGGKTLDGVIDGGKGHDTLILNYDADASLTNSWCHVTNLSSKNIKGIEMIDMQGTNVVDIRYSDLLSDTTNNGPLFIKGDSNDKVDLGANNWNSDNAGKSNLSDSTHNWWSWGAAWSKKGSETVDNVTYDVYHHSAAGSDTSNDVYVQQGVVVI